MSGLDSIPHKRGAALVAEYKERYGEKTLIAFSRGKDSIATALALRDTGLDLIPFHYDDLPGMEFVEESLAYYEKNLFNGRRILRMPHPAFYKHLRDMMFQPLQRANLLGNTSIPRLDHADIVRMVKKQEGIETEILSATGLRALDNAVRFLSIRKHGPIRPTAGNWAPIWDWTKQTLMNKIAGSGISLPPDYTFLPRSFDGFSYLYLIPIKERYPRDYQRILDWFPLARAEELRWEINERLNAKAV